MAASNARHAAAGLRLRRPCSLGSCGVLGTRAARPLLQRNPLLELVHWGCAGSLGQGMRSFNPNLSGTTLSVGGAQDARLWAQNTRLWAQANFSVGLGVRAVLTGPCKRRGCCGHKWALVFRWPVTPVPYPLYLLRSDML